MARKKGLFVPARELARVHPDARAVMEIVGQGYRAPLSQLEQYLRALPPGPVLRAVFVVPAATAADGMLMVGPPTAMRLVLVAAQKDPQRAFPAVVHEARGGSVAALALMLWHDEMSQPPGGRPGMKAGLTRHLQAAAAFDLPVPGNQELARMWTCSLREVQRVRKALKASAPELPA